MQTVLIVIHLLVVIAMVTAVLMQRSEGGGLGIGGGSNMMATRGSGNAMTRATAFLALAFFATSLSLSVLARYGERPVDIFDRLPIESPAGGGGILDQLGGDDAPAPPASAPEPAAPGVPNQ